MRFDIEKTITGLELVSLSEAKDHLRVSYTDEDDMINRMIRTARSWCEEYTQRALVDQTVVVQFYNLDGQLEFDLPYEKVGAISEVLRIKGDGTTQALVEGTSYRVLGLTRKIIRTNQFYDSGAFGGDSQIKVTYTLLQASQDQEEFKDAMLKLIADMYRNRENKESENPNATGEAYFAAKAILDPLRSKTWL